MTHTNEPPGVQTGAALPTQRRIWALEHVAQVRQEPHVFVCASEASVDFDSVERSLHAAMERHAVLRTSLNKSGARLEQVIRCALPAPIQRLDGVAPVDTSRLHDWLEQRMPFHFELAAPPLFRVGLTHDSSGRSLVVLVAHPAALDARSCSRLLAELCGAPEDRFASDHERPLMFEHERLESVAPGAAARILMEGSRLQLHSDFTSNDAGVHAESHVDVPLDEDTRLRLSALANDWRRSGEDLVLAAFLYFATRYCSQSDLVVALPYDARPPGYETALGPFTELAFVGSPDWDELRDHGFSRLVDVVSKARADAETCGTDLDGVLAGAVELASFPIFFDDIQSGRDVSGPGQSWSVRQLRRSGYSAQLALRVRGPAERVSIELWYAGRELHSETARQLAESFSVLLGQFAKAPESPIGKASLVDPARLAERDIRVVDDTLDALIERQAACTPDSVAIRDAEQTVSYAELLRYSDAFAEVLETSGVEPGDLVGICMSRTARLIPCLLGILKCGASYVPLDPSYPIARTEYMIRDSALGCVVVEPETAGAVPTGAHRLVFAETLGDSSTGRRATKASPSRVAYVIYTSGSTGEPKGVAVEHQSAVNFLVSMAEQPGMTEQDLLVSVTTLSFDISLLELFLPLSVGAEVFIAARDVVVDGERLCSLMSEVGATVLQATPTTWRQLLAAGFAGGERFRALCGGEPMPPDLAEALLSRCGQVWNMYGPTETTVWSTCHLLSRYDRQVSVGRAIANTTLYVVDAENRVLPEGAVGELAIGGVGVARGYLNRPELTAARFIPDPFSGRPGARWFLTGDRARWMPDGTLQILGRSDSQVKVHGHRVELGEIEAALTKHVDVRQCAVVVHDFAGNDRRLVCYYEVEAAPLDEYELRAFLSRSLPGYMVPSLFVPLESLPLTNNRKIDRRALPPLVAPLSRKARRTPQQSLECDVGQIFADVLGRDEVDLRRSFFELGGHSLLLIRVQQELFERLHVEVRVVDLFRFPSARALAGHLETVRDSCDLEVTPPPARSDDIESAVAVVGFSCRVPGADSVEGFWKNLSEGIESIRTLSEAEMLAAGVPKEDIERSDYVPAAATLSDIEAFDAAFFGIAASEAEILDPQHRLFLECTWEALEDAGYVTDAAKPVGVYAALDPSAYLRRNLSSWLSELSPARVFQVLTANDKDYLPTRVSYKLDFTGPAFGIQCACSSSLVAVHVACRALQTGDCELAIAGGVSVRIPQSAGYRFEEGMVHSPDGRCRAFAANAQGTVFGSGVGVVVLRRLSDALAAGDRIHAVIRASAVNNDGAAKMGYTTPSISGQSEVIARAHALAGISSERVGFVQAHGTGTKRGDPIEVEALTEAFRRSSSATGYCALGSIKSNVGHLDSAAGVVGLIAAALSVERGEIPPSLHAEELNPDLGLEETPFFVPRVCVPWSHSTGLRIAGVSALGVGGTNAHVVLEQAPTTSATEPAPSVGRWRILSLSTRSAVALQRQAVLCAEWLRAEDVDLDDACYSVNERRNHHSHRLAVAFDARANLVDALSGFAEGRKPAEVARGVAPAMRPRVAFVFPGHGGQWKGMGRSLYRTESMFREAFDRCDEAIRAEAGFSVVSEIYADRGRLANGDTEIVQPTLFALAVALSALWRGYGVEPDAVVGHSMGEIAAAHVCGALSLSNAVRVVVRRSRELRAVVGRGAMVLVELPFEEADNLLEAHRANAAVAVNNSPRYSVLSGSKEVLSDVVGVLSDRGVFHRWINVDYASHSPHMDEVLGRLSDALNGVEAKSGSIPFYSTVSGEPSDGAECDTSYWVRNLRDPVLFSRAIQRLSEDGHTLFVEISPTPMLGPSVTEVLSHRGAEGEILWTLRRERDDRASFYGALAAAHALGCELNWSSVRGPDARFVGFPAYAWDRQRHWIGPKRTSDVGSRSVAVQGADWPAPMLVAHRPSERIWRLMGEHVYRRATPASRVFRGVALEGTLLASLLTHVADAKDCVVEDLSITNVAFLQKADSLQLVEERGGDGSMRFSLFRLEREGTQFELVGSASVGAFGESIAPVVTPEALDVLDAHLWQRRCAEAGFDSPLPIEKLESDGEVALVTCRNPGEEPIAAALSLAAFLDDLSASHPPASWPRSLVGIENLIVRGEAPAEWQVVVERRGTLSVTDPEGRPWLVARGLRLADSIRVPERALERDFSYGIRFQYQQVTPAPSHRRRSPGPWLLLCTKPSVSARSLAKALEERGGCVRLLSPFDQRALCEFFERDRSSAGVLYAEALSDDQPSPLAAVAERLCVGLRNTVRALCVTETQTPLRIVTCGVQDTAAPSSVANAAVWGMGRAIALDHPELWGGLFDLPRTQSEHDCRRLAEELLRGDSEDQVLVLPEGRALARFERRRLAGAAKFELRPDSTYAVAGAFGVLGQRLSRWLVRRGARHLLLLSRRAPSEYGAGRDWRSPGGLIRELSQSGADVETRSLSIDDAAAVRAAFATCSHPVAGVVHAAGVQHQAAIENLSDADIEQVLGAKVAGSLALHEATKELALDFFVMLSSVAGVFGSRHEAHYSAANQFQDALARHRRQCGLKATSFALGRWQTSEGLSNAAVERHLADAGMAAIPTATVLALLEHAIASDVECPAVADIDWQRFTATFEARRERPLLEGLRPTTLASFTVPVRVAEPPGEPRVAEWTASSSVEMLALVTRELSRILGVDSVDIDRDAKFTSMGLESVMTVQLANRLRELLRVSLSPVVIFEHSTARRLASYLASVVRAPSKSQKPASAGDSNASIQARLASELAELAAEGGQA